MVLLFSVHEKKNSYYSKSGIGDDGCPMWLHIKAYVRHGEECSICYEPITSKRNCWLTFCGHTFCRKCLIQSRVAYTIPVWNGQFPCPLCREILPYDFSENLNEYSMPNGLDRLESFWDSIEFRTPWQCSGTGWEKNHNLGMKKECPDCQSYRVRGF